VFALDTSGSIGQDNVQEVVRFLQQIIISLNVDGKDSDATVSRIGMLTYADSATIQFQLDAYNRRTQILPAINVEYRGGKTNAADAIRYCTFFQLKYSYVYFIIVIYLPKV